MVTQTQLRSQFSKFETHRNSGCSWNAKVNNGMAFFFFFLCSTAILAYVELKLQPDERNQMIKDNAELQLLVSCFGSRTEALNKNSFVLLAEENYPTYHFKRPVVQSDEGFDKENKIQFSMKVIVGKIYTIRVKHQECTGSQAESGCVQKQVMVLNIR